MNNALDVALWRTGRDAGNDCGSSTHESSPWRAVYGTKTEMRGTTAAVKRMSRALDALEQDWSNSTQNTNAQHKQRTPTQKKTLHKTSTAKPSHKKTLHETYT